jgi:Zn-dependent oligopeptidase
MMMLVRGPARALRPVVALPSRRSILTWITDVVQTRSLTPPNPIIENWEISRLQPDRKDSTALTVTPRLSRVKPHHVEQAAVQIQDEYLTQLKVVESKAEAICSKVDSLQAADALVALQEIVSEMDRIEAPGRSLQQTASLLWLASEKETKSQWEKAAGQVSSTLNFAHGESENLHTALRKLLKSLEEETRDTSESIDPDTLWAANHLIRSYRQRVGTGLDTEKQQQFQDMSEALVDVEANLQFPAGRPATERMGDFYNYLGIRSEQAKMLGYPNVAEMVAESRMASVDAVNKLHQDVSERIRPLLASEMKARKSKDEVALDEYLSHTGDASVSSAKPGEVDPQRKDEFDMIRLQYHVTLEGALIFASRLSTDMLGVSFIEADTENVHGWHKDVRLFHAFDETDSSTYLGSFFLDPFGRSGKLERAMTTPIYVRGLESKPVVSVSLNLVAPMWDTLPVPVTFENVESLLHELGHVYQFLLAKPSLGGIVGPQNMPFDLSEFLPKFMEHWMMEKSTLYALINFSKSERGFSDDSIDAAYRVRSRRKMHELAQLTFFGSLEMSLFSDFDLRGSESMLALQNRTAQSFIPHDLPEDKDLSPLIDIMQENASGRHAGWYRYLWCDVFSAIVFDKFKQAYSDETSKMPQLRRDFRRLLLEPGAAIDVKELAKEFDVREFSLDPLFQRYSIEEKESAPEPE